MMDLCAIVKTSDQAKDQLDFLQSKLDCCLVIDGESLQVCFSLLLFWGIAQ